MGKRDLNSPAARARQDLPSVSPPSPAQPLFVREGEQFREAADQDVLTYAQALVTQRFHRGYPVFADTHALRAFLQIHLAPLQYICFAALFLDPRKRLLAYHCLFRGSVDACLVHPREVLREALASNATGVVLVRNDPYGDVHFYEYDARIWKSVRAALALVDIELLDYLLVGARVVSCKEEGLVETKH